MRMITFIPHQEDLYQNTNTFNYNDFVNDNTAKFELSVKLLVYVMEIGQH